MAVQNGTQVYTGATEVVELDNIVKSTAGTYSTKYTAIGVTGAEIGFVYQVNEDGTYGRVFTQVGTTTEVASGTFYYDATTNLITLFTDDVTELGTATIACSYDRATTDAAQLITVDGGAIPDTVLVTASGLAKDVCTGELFPCQVDGMAQVDGNYTFDLSADGDPAVQSLNMEFVRACSSKKLYDFVVYTDETEDVTP